MRLLTALLIIFAFPVSVSGHHSRAEFLNETVEIEGVLTEVIWRNPHIALFVDVASTTGEIESWRVEGWTRPAALESAGVTPDLFAVGDRLTVAGRPSRFRQALLATNALLVNGTEAVMAPVDPRWDGVTLGTEPRSMPQVADAAAENLGFFRAWYPAGNPMAALRNFAFTDEAIASREAWNPVDNPIVRCEPPGLPVPMFHPRPILFLDEGEEIGLHHSYLDTRRTIYLGDEENEADQRPSRLGYSKGRWEDASTLIVETSRINYPFFHIDGTAQTDAIRITERYTLSDDQARLDFELTIDDPVTLEAPATIESHFVALNEPFSVYECNAF